MAYTKTTWNTGDVITADKLNNLESGVAAANAAATSSTPGLVKQAAHMDDLSATPTQTDFNNLLSALQAAGLMAEE